MVDADDTYPAGIAKKMGKMILNKEADKQEKEKQRLEEEKEKEEEIPDIDLDHIDDIEGLGGKEYDFNDFDNE